MDGSIKYQYLLMKLSKPISGAKTNLYKLRVGSMTIQVNNEKDFSNALKSGEESIEIVGDLAKKTIRIRATGKVAWGIAIGAIGIAAYSIISIPVTAPATGGTTVIAGVTANLVAAPAAIVILGGPATYTAIAIAVASGGVGALTSLRKYKEVSRTSNSLILKRR